jgi:hypothetical protein
MVQQLSQGSSTSSLASTRVDIKKEITDEVAAMFDLTQTRMDWKSVITQQMIAKKKTAKEIKAFSEEWANRVGENEPVTEEQKSAQDFMVFW